MEQGYVCRRASDVENKGAGMDCVCSNEGFSLFSSWELPSGKLGSMPVILEGGEFLSLV